MDIYGKALLDYQNNNYTEDLESETSISTWDVFPLPYLFRTIKDMPEMETKALELAKGKVLDIGCGAGSHSLYLQNKGFDVTAIDTSVGAIEVCQARGIKKTLNQDVTTLSSENKYDTLLLLMNGAGMAGRLKNTLGFLLKLKELLNPGGQILLDSSDIIYMFEDEDGGTWIDMNKDYYGEVIFKMRYKGQESAPFDWVYLDFDTLKTIAEQAGLKCEKLIEGSHYDYLARLS